MMSARWARDRVWWTLSRLRHPDLRNVALYGAATALAAVLTLIQTRVLWHALRPSDFGLWSLIDPMLLPGASLLLFGIEYAIVKQVRVDHLPMRDVVGNLLVSTVPATALCLVVMGLVSNLVFHVVWTSALLLTVAGEALILIIQTALRATGAIIVFAVILVARNLFYLLLLLLISSHQAAASLPIGLVFLMRGACVVAIGFVTAAAMRPAPSLDWARYLDAVRYGFPLLLTIFIYAMSDMADRWLLAEFQGVTAVGVYSLHLKIAAILSQAIVIPFGLWFPPERFKHLEDADRGQAFFIRTAVVLAVICSYLSGAVWLGRDSLLPLIAPGAIASSPVLACCLGGMTCLALSQALNVGLLMSGHTAKNVACNAGSMAATFLSAFVMVPLLGVVGAGLGRLLGGLVLVGLTAAWSNRVFPIAFPFGSLILYLLASAIAALGIDTVSSGHGLLGAAAALLAWSMTTIAFATIAWARLHAPVRQLAN